MFLFKILHLFLFGKPHKTELLVCPSSLILKKRDKGTHKGTKQYEKYIKQIQKYRYILEPVIVTQEDFSRRYVIRGNAPAYQALVDSGFARIPIKIKKK